MFMYKYISYMFMVKNKEKEIYKEKEIRKMEVNF